MFRKFLKLSSLLLSLTAWAGDFQYFEGGIDYWNDASKRVEEIKKPIVPMTKSNAEITDGSKFVWSKYLDPKNKEFFKEGEYAPPEPFMEIVRNPTDENLKMWFAYIDKKNELASRLDTRMKEFVGSHGLIPTEEKNILLARGSALPKMSEATKRFRFRMYFDSKCPHCKKMMGTLEDLQNRGFLVEARQVDGGEAPAVLFPIVRANSKEMAEKEVQNVPLLLIGDLQKKVVYRLPGYQSTEAVINALKNGGSEM